MGRKIISVIGGGSVFSPELVSKLCEYSRWIGEMELRLMDIDQERLEIVGGLCKRIVEKRNKNGIVTIELMHDYEAAIKNSDFVLVQFRQGGVNARIEDEKLGLKYRLPFTETISVCGFATFLRTYPVIEKLSGLIQKYAPDAWVMNFTNPSGQVSEAFSKLGCKKVIGVCNGSVGMIGYLCEKTGLPPDETYMNWRGLNHLTAVDGLYYQGKNYYSDFIESMKNEDVILGFPAELIRVLGFIPNGYMQYYYLKERVIKKLQSQEKVRSVVVKEIENVLLEKFKEADEIPEELTLRGGYGYSTIIASIIKGIVTDDNSLNYAVVRNGSTFQELPEDAFIEVPVCIRAQSIRPVHVEPLPQAARSLVITMKQYDQTAIEGAQKRDLDILLRSLLIHPLIACYDIAKPLLQDVLEANRPFLNY